MKVLYIINSTDTMEGSTISFINMVNGVKNKGLDMTIIYPDNSHKLEIIHSFNDLEINCCPAPVVMSVYPRLSFHLIHIVLFIPKVFNLIFQKQKSFIQIKKIVKEIRPDIIHTNTGVVHEGYAVAKKCNIPHCWHLREYQDKDFNWVIFPDKKSFIKKLKQSMVITISDDLRRYFTLDAYIHAKTVYNGILPASFAAYTDKKEKYFLCASRISPEKRQEEIITVFTKFCEYRTDYKLIIAGSGDAAYINELNNLTQSLNCSDNIKFIGHREKENIYDRMKKATALIVASKYEGFGRMTAEALFCGCLVIGNNSGGTKEILENTEELLYSGQTGLLDCLLNVVEIVNTEKYKTKVLADQKSFIKKYSIEQNIENIYAIYEEILQTG